jgi:hypothetical protein
VEYDSNFRLYLQTKLANPHYKPEIAAQCTLVNFCVTEKVRRAAVAPGGGGGQHLLLLIARA